VDTDRSPAAIDLKPEDGAQPGKPVKGIFAVDRDELKLCLGGKDGADRPTAFRSTDGNGAVLIVLKRAKGKSG
jgi:uncharacterized protein (TIGR03067 family)